MQTLLAAAAGVGLVLAGGNAAAPFFYAVASVVAAAVCCGIAYKTVLARCNVADSHYCEVEVAAAAAAIVVWTAIAAAAAAAVAFCTATGAAAGIAVCPATAAVEPSPNFRRSRQTCSDNVRAAAFPRLPWELQCLCLLNERPELSTKVGRDVFA